MTSKDIEYYRARAATERVLAQASNDPKVAAIHEELSRRYEALIRHTELRLVAA